MVRPQQRPPSRPPVREERFVASAPACSRISASRAGPIPAVPVGLINGPFYALLSFRLPVIFGMLSIINFTHGAQYISSPSPFPICCCNSQGFSSGNQLLVGTTLRPILVGVTGVLIEPLFLKYLRKLDPLYVLLLTFGLALVIEGLSATITAPPCPIRRRTACRAGTISASCSFPIIAPGSSCSRLRCALRPRLRSSAPGSAPICAPQRRIEPGPRLGIDVPLMITLTYGFRVALAALAGVMAAPIYESRRRWAPISSSSCSRSW